MPSPFPGMDPFLENPQVFPDLHDTMVTLLKLALKAKLPKLYFASIGSRVWVEVSRRYVGPDVKITAPAETRRGRGPKGGTIVAEQLRTEPVVVTVPHDEHREPSLEIHIKENGQKRLVTSIEVLSPTNKTPGECGRDFYLQKQREILESKTNLVEIDLLRRGEHTTAVPLELAIDKAGTFDYHVCVHRFERFSEFFVYPIPLPRQLPVIAIPLLPGDADVTIDLQVVFNQCYDASDYRLQLNYAHAVLVPTLSTEQVEWVRKVLKNKGITWIPRNGKRGS